MKGNPAEIESARKTMLQEFVDHEYSMSKKHVRDYVQARCML